MQFVHDTVIKLELSPFLGIEETQKMIMVSKRMKTIFEERLYKITEKEVCHYVDYKVAQNKDEWSNNLIFQEIINYLMSHKKHRLQLTTINLILYTCKNYYNEGPQQNLYFGRQEQYKV
jgi:Mg2+/citrate symporter